MRLLPGALLLVALVGVSRADVLITGLSFNDLALTNVNANKALYESAVLVATANDLVGASTSSALYFNAVETGNSITLDACLQTSDDAGVVAAWNANSAATESALDTNADAEGALAAAAHDAAGVASAVADCVPASTAAPTTPPAPTTTPECPLGNIVVDDLGIEYPPEWDHDLSGFVTPDVLTIYFDNFDQWTITNVTFGVPDNLVTSTPIGRPPAGTYGANTGCYTRYQAVVDYAALVDNGALAKIETDPDFIIFTGELVVSNEIDAGVNERGQPKIRILTSPFLFEVRFPKRVSVTLADLSLFHPAFLYKAILTQSVRVALPSGDATAEVTLVTSVQWPFKLVSGTEQIGGVVFPDPANPVSAGTVTSQTISNTSNIPVTEYFVSSDCADAGAVGQRPDICNDVINEQADPVLCSCNQEWTVKLDPDETQVCELDGHYVTVWRLACQDSFSSDCPLAQDDFDEPSPIARMDWYLDSEIFCPQVIDTVDIGATLTLWKDIRHEQPATNFFIGQTAYFVLATASNKATITSTTIDDIRVTFRGGDTYAVENKVVGAFIPTIALQNSGTDLTGLGAAVPFVGQVEAWFQFLVDTTPFDVAFDGSEDFDITVVADITFADVDLLDERVELSFPGSKRLLQQSQFGRGIVEVKNVGIVREPQATTAGPDGETSAAGAAACAASALLVAAAASF